MRLGIDNQTDRNIISLPGIIDGLESLIQRKHMKKENCEACGKVIEKKYAVEYPIVPEEVAKLHNIRNSRTVRICLECARELPPWFHKSVSNVTYNNKTQHFRYKTPDELIEEYESAFRSYAHFKRRK